MSIVSSEPSIPSQVESRDAFNSQYTLPVRRGAFEVKMDLLNIIQFEALPTRIMYLSRLNWKTMQKLLTELVDKGLITKVFNMNKDSRIKFVYKITDTGKLALERYKGIDI